MTLTDPVQDQLAWERSRRVMAAVAAGVAGVFTLAPVFYVNSSIGDDEPVIGVVQALTPALEGRLEPVVNPRTAAAQFLVDHGTELVITGVLTAIGVLAIGIVLLYLYRAAQARLPGMPRYVRGMITFGAALMAVGSVALPIARRVAADDYLQGTDRSREAINDALGAGTVTIFGSIALLGTLALCLATILVALNAMRAGLLTRFMGILGIIVGVLFILGGLLGQFPVVQAFWFLALVPLLLGSWPRGNPPAWESGQAEPWPSAAEVREQRMQGAGRAPVPRNAADNGAGDVELAEDAADPRPAPHPATSRKKRRKRR